MPTDIVLTLTGPDRVGIVGDVTKAIRELGGNVGTSRMARLGGAFSILALVTLPTEDFDAVAAAFADLADEGYAVSISETSAEPAEGRDAWKPFDIMVSGADHEGIVADIASGLSQQGVTIETAETCVTEAAVTGAPLFSMSVSVLVPPSIDDVTWQESLAEAADRAGVDVEVTAG